MVGFHGNIYSLYGLNPSLLNRPSNFVHNYVAFWRTYYLAIIRHIRKKLSCVSLYWSFTLYHRFVMATKTALVNNSKWWSLWINFHWLNLSLRLLRYFMDWEVAKCTYEYFNQWWTEICNRLHVLESKIFCKIIILISFDTLLIYSHISSGNAHPNTMVKRQMCHLEIKLYWGTFHTTRYNISCCLLRFGWINVNLNETDQPFISVSPKMTKDSREGT